MAYGITIGTNLIHAPNLYTQWGTLIPAMQTRGFTWMRLQRIWSKIETSQGVYDFSIWDDAVPRLNAAGINVLLTVQGAPTWALTTSYMQQTNVPDYMFDPDLATGFAMKVCDRYRPGSPYGTIQAFGYNEDANITFDSPGAAGIRVSPYTCYNATGGILTSANVQPARDGYFAGLVVTRVNRTLRQYHPQLLLGLPCLWWRQHPNTLNYFQSMYDTIPDLNTLYDFADFHFYSQVNNPLTAGSGANYATSVYQTISDIQTTLRANGATSKQLWPTEFGWRVPTDCDAPTQSARYAAVLAAFLQSWSGGGPRIGNIFMYTYDYMGTDTNSLVVSNGMGGWTYNAADTTLTNFIATYPNGIGVAL